MLLSKLLPKLLCFFCLLAYALPAGAQTSTVKQLYDEYRANRTAFQGKYKNRSITVTGKVRSISRASSYWKDAHRVHLTATGYENFVVCQLPYKDSALLDQVKVGEELTVTGTTGANISDALYLDNCSFSKAKAPVAASTAPENAPLGKYNVYQDNGSGFNFQYSLYLRSYNLYVVNGRSGICVYDPKAKTIRFTSGPLKGFAGLYRKTTDNPKDPPGFLLNAQGSIPVEKSLHKGYQFAYFQGK